ncbi:hypothetical protein [Synechocystis sp. CACIAM 05]|uniref:hypothetical protein n=1 Tax=Synechocystis sp. CACIAM 05 TaxID=1933929 RepID=UPI00138E8B2B|nr:hypothetical protein [Synechocystis sp. CACIAM 05]QHU99748.1 hypothetical protein BWK47_06095 [Synechocystis sp. CACIAM 05]
MPSPLTSPWLIRSHRHPSSTALEFDQNMISQPQGFTRLSRSSHRFFPARWLMAFGWGVGLMALGSLPLNAATIAQGNVTERQVRALIEQFDAVANQHNTDRLGEIYSPEFSNSDGLTFAQMETTLQQLWETYGNLTYSTELKNWKQDGQAVVVETLTTIQGERPWLGRTAQLNGEITSRQTFVQDKLVRQEVLTEKMTLTAGDNPPEVDVNLPQQVQAGQQFDFDVILRQPIGDDLLAGTAFSQKINPDNYIDPSQVKLELLQAGGLFKRAIAGNDPQWLSALLVTPEGMVLVTQRLAVVPQ